MKFRLLLATYAFPFLGIDGCEFCKNKKLSAFLSALILFSLGMYFADLPCVENEEVQTPGSHQTP